jgi:hypothetical protein
LRIAPNTIFIGARLESMSAQPPPFLFTFSVAFFTKLKHKATTNEIKHLARGCHVSKA